ncbi:bestrophin family ion channel [Flavobacterium granuli]|uniref:Membrane protein n=1 Tax=Flavobacterium granuli TaxID=280093 RepID=A0ABU1RZQ7_9FLAO|nr:bestrophin family ion channel [Flavobacterium granuli]MDR6844269.1 putative membrane protein [Flavobacterium granuli]
MISYNPKIWFAYIFRFHKSDSFRKLLPSILVIALYSGIVAYLEIEYFKLDDTSHVKNLFVIHTTLGFVISLLLAYRINSAYDRWWEGRKLWGSLMNNSRNLAIKLSVILKDEKDLAYFRKLIPSYASMLNKHLKDEETSMQLFEQVDLVIDHHKHRPNQVAKMIFQKINDLYITHKISGDQLIILNNEFQSFTDICGACERIKNTPIPYSYSAFIKKFIFIFVLTLPYAYSFTLGYYVIPVVSFIFYVLVSIELISEEIEEPFGYDENDLPTTKIAENIKKYIEEIL